MKIYHDALEPFNFAELEKSAVARGVVQQSVKEINTNLVHDFKVQTDKMGSGIFFWSFPSKRRQELIQQIEVYESQLENVRNSVKETQEEKKRAASMRCADDRPMKMQRMQKLISEEQKLDALLESNKQNDPEEIKRIQESAAVCQIGACRWTDNIWSLKSWLVKKKNIPGKELDKHLQIGDDFDYPNFSTSRKGKGKDSKSVSGKSGAKNKPSLLSQ